MNSLKKSYIFQAWGNKNRAGYYTIFLLSEDRVNSPGSVSLEGRNKKDMEELISKYNIVGMNLDMEKPRKNSVFRDIHELYRLKFV